MHLHVPVGADKQQASTGQLPGDKLQQRQARPVGPVKIVEDHQQTSREGSPPKEVAYCLVEVEAGHFWVLDGCWRRMGNGLGQLRQKLGHRGDVLPELD
jgi:hypothetical protein